MNSRLPCLSLSLALLAAGASLLLAGAAQANDPPSPDIPDGVVSLHTVEPERNVGYTVGDILERQVTLTVKKPYTLVETTLPIVGYEHRYKGQVSGIELRRIRHDSEDQGDSTVYHIILAYQVFTNNVVAKPAILPGEIIKFLGPAKTPGKRELVQYRIPSWSFRISPIATFGEVKIELDMSPMRGPLLLDAKPEQQRIKVLLVILALSLLGLLYILGKRAWLPLMGRPFARAYRAIRRQPHDQTGLEQAVSSLHQALNSTAGYSVFSHNLPQFIAAHAGFAAVQEELQQFFALSRHVFFEPQAPHPAGADPLAWLAQLCRRCRDCERGLTPASQPGA